MSIVSPSSPILHHDVEEREDGKFLVVEINLQHQVKDILAALKPLLPRSRPTGPRQKQKRKVHPWEAMVRIKGRYFIGDYSVEEHEDSVAVERKDGRG